MKKEEAGLKVLMSETDALQRLADDIIVLLTQEPFYAYLLVKMNKKIDRRVPVAGVSVINGEIILYINPEGYMNYTKPERLFILKHEVLHVINIHYLRRRDRDPELFNVAADVAINQLIESPYCQFPADALKIDSWQKDKGFTLPAKQSTEEYYQILFNRGEKIDIPQDLLDSIMGKHLQGQACDNCGGTGHEPKPQTIKGVVERKISSKRQIEIEGKVITINDETQFSSELDPSFDESKLKEGQIAEVKGRMVGSFRFDADEINIKPLKGKIEKLDVDNSTFSVGDLKVNLKPTTEFYDLEGNEIEASDLKDGDTVLVEEKYAGKIKEKFNYDAIKVLIQEEQEDEQDDSSGGSGDGSGDSDGEGEQKCSCCGGSGQEGSGSGSGSGGFAGLHPTWEDSTDLSEQLAENIVRSMVSEAVSKTRGNVPASIKQMIDEMMESKVNWRGILRNFVAKRRSTKKSPTWRKRSRRLGTLVPGNKKNRKLNLVVAVDTSGSVSDKELALFTGEIQKIYQSGADITVIECDAAVQNVYQYTKKIERSNGMTFKGRGGTDFRPVFEYILDPVKTKVKPDAVIFLTDGYGPAPDVFKIPTLWCLTPGGRRPYNSSMRGDVSWGNVLTLVD